MPIFPGFNGFPQRSLKSDQIVQGAAAFVVVPANGRFGEIKMSVAARIVALSKQLSVLFV